jgi:hypothetical protein
MFECTYLSDFKLTKSCSLANAQSRSDVLRQRGGRRGDMDIEKQTCVIPCWPWNRALTSTPYYRDISHLSGCFHPVACGHVAIREENDGGAAVSPPATRTTGAQQLTLPQRRSQTTAPRSTCHRGEREVAGAEPSRLASGHHVTPTRGNGKSGARGRGGRVGGLRERDQHRRQRQPRFQLGNCWPPLISSRSRNGKQKVFCSCYKKNLHAWL